MNISENRDYVRAAFEQAVGKALDDERRRRSIAELLSEQLGAGWHVHHVVTQGVYRKHFQALVKDAEGNTYSPRVDLT